MHVRHGSWTIQRQMVLGSAVLLAMMGTLVVGANLLLRGLQREVRSLTAHVSPSVVVLLNIDRDGCQAQLALERIVAASTGGAGGDEAALADARADWDENTGQTLSRFEQFVARSAPLPGEAEQRAEIVALRSAWLNAGEAILAAPPEERAAGLEGMRAAFGTYREALDELESELYEAEASRLVERVDDRQRMLVVANWLALGLALLVGAVFVRWVSGRVAKVIRHRSALVHAASNDLGRLAGGITDQASSTASQARAATDAAEQVASAVDAVNVAVEELSACIQEIASNAAVATTIAGDAVATAADSNRIITQLGASSQEIDEVVKVINDIAEQTNLLALNATIEAARAGESGRGFSVVATEVKELASETARATGEIAGRVAAIQRDTAAAVEANQRINAIIERISEYQHNIAAAIEEQSITTAQIARSASDAATGSSAISSTVSSVAAEAAQTFATGDTTAQQATQLTKLADEFNALVGVTRGA